MTDPDDLSNATGFSPSAEPAQAGGALAPNATHPENSEDYYMDGPYLVFTAAYHLRRGSCCKSDCRHCPYR
jgi:hypothetical protein